MRHARSPRSIGRSGGAIRLETVAKPGGGFRTLTHLDERDRRRYDAAVGAVTLPVERALTPGVAANRARPANGRLELEPWRLARNRYLRAIAAASRGPSRAAFVGDVLDCYGSITPAAVERALRRIGVSRDGVERVSEVLRVFESRGVRGLPIGPHPSAVLANAVLAPVECAMADSGGGPVLRWVDDVVVFAADARGARRVAAAFERSLDELGLSAHPNKCKIVDQPSVVLSSASRPSASRAPDMA